MDETVRFRQRLQNFEKALRQLQEGVQLKSPNALEKQGIIQRFEFTFELAWKSLKDYLESQKVEAAFPRDVIKQALHYHLIEDGDAWMEMLAARNFLTHTYDEQKAEEAYLKIKNQYTPLLDHVFSLLKSRPAG